MVVLKVNRTPDVINAAVKERQLDLRGRDMRSIEDLGGTEDQFDTIDLSENMIIKLDNFPCLNRLGTLLASNNRINHICPNIGELLPKLHTLVLMNNDITSLAEIDPLASLPKLNSLYLLENPVTEKPDYRFYVIHRLKRLLSLDFEKVKQQERTTAEHKFHSKEAEEEVKKTFAQAYTPMKAVGAQYITEDPGPKAVSPVPAIKALSTDQMAAERAFLKREIDMVEVLEKTDRIKGPNHENGADEQVQSGESTPIQEVKVIILNNWTIDIDQEILGAGPDSIYVTLPGHIEEYIYKNFQRTPFRFIFSWRKRLFKEMHILPLPRMQIQGDCAYNSTVTLMECHLKVLFARRPAGMCRTFNVRLSAKHLKQMVSAYYESKAGKDLKLGELLFTCLRMAERHGVVSEEDFDAGCPRKAIRYKIKSFRKLRDKEKLHIPKRLEKAEMVITSFRVTDVYQRILPHEICRYEAPEEHIKVHPAHCVVLTSSGLEYRDLENMPGNDKIDDPEVYYESLNSYNGWGIDGSGYIYADSIRESYVIKIAEPTHM